MKDARKFTKYTTKLKKSCQTLSSALRRRSETSAYADQAAFSLVMKVVFLKFLGLQNNSSQSKNELLFKSRLQELSAAPSGLFDFLSVQEDSPCLSEDLSPAIGEMRREVASLCDDLLQIKGRNILGDIYESLLNADNKKRAGQYYTPDFIVDYILSETLDKVNILENPCPSVLDPACGCGHFLLKAYDLLKDKLRRNLPELRNLHKRSDYHVTDSSGRSAAIKGTDYWQEENLHYHLLRHCLFGADIDGNAAGLTLAALMFKDEFSFLPVTNIICCDSLLPPEDLNHPDFSLKYSRFWSRKYDYIIGNPPYLSFGLNRKGKLKNTEADRLRLTYPNSAQYKISYYALFFERSVKLLTPGAKMGFITPDSFLLGRYFSKIRRFILDHCLIDEVFLLNQPVFAASVGFPVISIFTKTAGNQDLSLKYIHFIKAKQWFKNNPPVTYSYPQNYFERQPYFRFRLFFNQTDKDIVDKMDKSPYLLSHFTKIKTGMRSLTSQKDIILGKDQPREKTFQRGIISSSEVKPFFIDYQGNWLNVDPVKLNAGGWDKSIIENPKILIRQTGSSLIAAIDEDNLYHLNNVHSISLAGAEVSLEYLLSLLNSRLMNYYYRTVSLEAGRAMAQTDIEALEKLPVVLSFEHLEAMTITAKKLKRSLRLYNTLKNNNGLKEKLLLSSISRFQTRLDDTIYRLYGLSAEEIRRVEGKQP